MRFAQGVNLHNGDIAGMWSGGSEREQTIPRHGARLCGKTIHPGEAFLVDRGSTVFTVTTIPPKPGEPTVVASSVKVFKSAREASAADAARANPRLLRCLADEAERESRTSHEAKRVSVTGVAAPSSGPPGVTVLRYRTENRASPRGFSPVRYLDELSFLVGPAKVGLSVSSEAAPPSAGAERRLLALLYRRATSPSARALLSG